MMPNESNSSAKDVVSAKVIPAHLEELRLDEWGCLLLPDGREFHVASQVLKTLAILTKIPEHFFLSVDIVCQSFLFNHLIARRRQQRRHPTHIELHTNDADEVVSLEVCTGRSDFLPLRSR
jgi:hypothetical protein